MNSARSTFSRITSKCAAGHYYLEIALISYFSLQLVLLLIQAPVFEGFGIRITSSDLLLILLFATVVGNYDTRLTKLEHTYAFLFGLCGIFLYFHSSTVFSYLSQILLIGGITTVVFSPRYGFGQSIELHSQFTGLTVLLALTAGLLRSWRWVPDLVLACVTIYALYRYFTNTPVEDTPRGIGNVLFSTVTKFGQSTAGVATGGILYMGFFSHVSTAAMLAPVILNIFVRRPVEPTLENVVVNLSVLFRMIFLAVFLLYWISLLQRVPYSVRHWESGTYDYDRESQAPNRPLIRGMALPVLGLALANIPGWDISTHGPRITTLWVDFILKILLIVLLVLLAYSVAGIPHAGRLRRILPKGKWFVSERPSIKGDFRVYLAAGILAIALNVVMINARVVPILLGYLVLFLLEVHVSTIGGLTTLLVTGLIFGILAPKIAPLPDGTGAFWSVLVFLLFVYGLAIVRVRSDSIAAMMRT